MHTANKSLHCTLYIYCLWCREIWR